MLKILSTNVKRWDVSIKTLQDDLSWLWLSMISMISMILMISMISMISMILMISMIQNHLAKINREDERIHQTISPIQTLPDASRWPRCDQRLWMARNILFVKRFLRHSVWVLRIRKLNISRFVNSAGLQHLKSWDSNNWCFGLHWVLLNCLKQMAWIAQTVSTFQTLIKLFRMSLTQWFTKIRCSVMCSICKAFCGILCRTLYYRLCRKRTVKPMHNRT